MRFKLIEAFGDQHIQIKLPILITLGEGADEQYKSTKAYEESFNICITSAQIRILMDIYKNISYFKDILNVAQFDFSYLGFEDPHLIFDLVVDSKITEEDLLKAIKRYMTISQETVNNESNIEMSINTLTDYIKVNFN